MNANTTVIIAIVSAAKSRVPEQIQNTKYVSVKFCQLKIGISQHTSVFVRIVCAHNMSRQKVPNFN